MLGAIIGDIAGSRYEWHNIKWQPNELFGKGCHPTDDSVMTIAVARALMDSNGMNRRETKVNLVNSMKYFGNLFPDAGYGGKFREWLKAPTSKPYNSWGNGSAMRVASVGWLYDSLEETEDYAAITASVTHNHPEGIKGAQAIAACIFMARKGKPKEEIKEYIESKYYKLDFTLDEIRVDYTFDVSCQGSCPQAIEAFLESEDFEHAVKLAISIGGDSDTIAAMTGAIAEAYYGIPDEIKNEVFEYLKDHHGMHVTANNSILREEWERFEDKVIKGSKE